MNKPGKPHGASQIVNEVTDPRRRRSTLSVVLNTLHACRTVYDRAARSGSTSNAFSARRMHAFSALLLSILRDADLSEDEVEDAKRSLIRITRKEWREASDRIAPRPHRALILVILKRLSNLCESAERLYPKGGGANNQLMIQAAQEYRRDIGERILRSDLSDEEKQAAFEEQRRESRPHETTATEAGIEMLCKILRESHLTRHELLISLDMLTNERSRAYDPESPVPEALAYTMQELHKHLRPQPR